MSSLVTTASELTNQTKNVFERYGFRSGFMTDGYSLSTRLNWIRGEAEELGFELPTINPLLLVHNLGAGDFDSAYLYGIDGNPVAMNGGPTLNRINGLCRDLTRMFPEDVLISYYENDRFAIPVLTLWERGKIVAESANAGSERYKEDYWKEDEEAYIKRCTENGSGLIEKMIKAIEEN